MPKYDLAGVDGNVFAVIGYTRRVLKYAGLVDLIPEMQQDAMSGGYDHAIQVCMRYVDIANQSDSEEMD